MKMIREIKQKEVWDHWKTVEGFSNDDFRSDIRGKLLQDMEWFLAKTQKEDLSRIYIISSDDWREDKICSPDFKLITAISNYKASNCNIGKYKDIREKEVIFRNNIDALDKKLIFVAPTQKGVFTIIEGNKRAIALGSLGSFNNLGVFLGVSDSIKDFVWVRYSN